MQVLLPAQIAMLSVKTWPTVPDLISLGCAAESQLQGSELQVVRCAASQQPGQPTQQLDELIVFGDALTQPAGRLHQTMEGLGQQADSQHAGGSPPPQPPSAQPSSSHAAAQSAIPACKHGCPCLGLQQLQNSSPTSMSILSQAILPTTRRSTASGAWPQHPRADPLCSRTFGHQVQLPAGEWEQVWGLQGAAGTRQLGKQGSPVGELTLPADNPLLSLGQASHIGWGSVRTQTAHAGLQHDDVYYTPGGVGSSIGGCSHASIADPILERPLSRDTMDMLEALVCQHPSVTS